MGAYLSSPVTEKISCDKSCSGYTYGASSMQGWRINQEDAHNCIPDFDELSQTAMFAVYDGHGGSEVAQYCSKYLPDCIKETEQYKEGELGPALIDAFLKFDSTLVQEDVIKELKQLAGVDENDEEEEEEDQVGRCEAEDLRVEADLPLDELLAKYKTPPGGTAVKNLRKKENIQSPAIRAKKDTADSGSGPSSSSDGAGSFCSNGSLLANGVADNENNQNKEKELQDSAMSSSSHPEGEDSVLTEQSNSSGKAACSSHTSSNQPCAGDSGDSGDMVSSTGCGEGEGCGKKGEVKGSEGSSSSSSGSTSKSSAPSSDGVSSSSAVKDDSPSGSGSGSSTAGGSAAVSSAAVSSGSAAVSSGSAASSSGSAAGGSSSAAGGSSSSAAGGSSSSSSGSSGDNSGSTKTRAGAQANEEDMDSDDDSDEEENEEEWQDIESEDDDDEEESMEDGDEPMMDMSNEEPGSDSGCTACVVLLRGEQLVVANSGDSRCVLCRGGTAVDLSTDHKPEDDTERLRIENAGGRVTGDGRVNGGLNLSRAIGDHFYKRKEDLPPEQQMITALPDIETASLDPMDQFFVVACDGIWNSMSSQDCVNFIADRLKDPVKKSKPSLICEELFEHCLAENTYGDGTGCDNMTCIIVVLHPQDQQHGENGIVPSKRCMSELGTVEENSEKRPRIEEGQEGESKMVEGEGTEASSQ